MARSLLALCLLACSTPAPRLTDSFGNTVLDPDEAPDSPAYALGASFELFGSRAADLASSNPDVLDIVRDGDTFAVRATAEGTTTLTYLTAHEPEASVTVMPATSLLVPDAVVLDGGFARIVVVAENAENAGVPLGVREQATVGGAEDARVVTPIFGADEIWATAPEDPTDPWSLTITIEGESFTLELLRADTSVVTELTLEVDPFGILQARLWTADGRQVLGGTFSWSLDGDDVSTRDTPGDRMQQILGQQARELCVESLGFRACRTTAAEGYRAI